MLVEVFDERHDSGLYTLKFYLLDYIVEGIQRFGALYALDRRLYEHVNVFT